MGKHGGDDAKSETVDAESFLSLSTLLALVSQAGGEGEELAPVLAVVSSLCYWASRTRSDVPGAASSRLLLAAAARDAMTKVLCQR